MQPEPALLSDLPAEVSQVLTGERRWAVLNCRWQDLLPRLPSLCIDVVLTDSPYSEEVHTQQRRVEDVVTVDKAKQRQVIKKRVTSDDLEFPPLTAAERLAVCAEFGRLCRRWCVCYTDFESAFYWRRDLETSGLEHVRPGIWIKRGAQPQLNGQGPATAMETVEIANQPGWEVDNESEFGFLEIAYRARRLGKKHWNDGGMHAIWEEWVENGKGEVRIHPTQKPLKLAMKQVGQFTMPNELVLDPFGGGFTFGVACQRLGRRYLACEMDTEHNWYQDGFSRMLAEQNGCSAQQFKAGQMGLFGVSGG